LPDTGKYISRLVTNIFSVLISLVLTHASWKFVQDEQIMGSVIFNDVPAWYFQIIIPVGFLLMSLRFLILSVENTVSILTRKKGDQS
jgi:TRAP-type C4-dicarboxylate transport system permease small subunit